MLAALDLYPDSEFLAYGLTEAEVHLLRSRFKDWRMALINDSS
jgi:hypothetical protein